MADLFICSEEKLKTVDKKTAKETIKIVDKMNKKAKDEDF